MMKYERLNNLLFECRGISNTAGTLSGVIGVTLTGLLLERAGGAENPEGWKQAMVFSAIQGLLASMIFVRFARGDRLFGGDASNFQQ